MILLYSSLEHRNLKLSLFPFLIRNTSILSIFFELDIGYYIVLNYFLLELSQFEPVYMPEKQVIVLKYLKSIHPFKSYRLVSKKCILSQLQIEGLLKKLVFVIKILSDHRFSLFFILLEAYFRHQSRFEVFKIKNQSDHRDQTRNFYQLTLKYRQEDYI